MSADTTEQNAANGEHLRERYLPVSRKELRRRREAELAAQRQLEAGTGGTSETSESSDVSPAEETATSALSPEQEPEVQNEAEDELSRAIQATFASESDELPQEPETGEDPDVEATSSDDDESTTEDEVSAPPQPEVGSAESAVLPEPEEAPARPEEEIADAEVEAEFVLDEEDTTQDISRVAAPPEVQTTDESQEAAQVPDEEEDLPSSEPVGTESVPASTAESRRVRRMLRETQSIPPLSPELLAELDATNAEIAKAEDATAVDPELLKRQQSLAAKAMQANQERMRKEHAKAEKERRRRSRERPESQVLTEKMVRDSLEQDPEDMRYATGQIEPVHAQGAHGLDLNKMIDATSRQADRQKVLMWTAIVLGLLLFVAIATVAFVLV
ncbi:hypothetical protein [Nesterenkonia natronophila]|uniref:Uncharacterized protein n=1 Tax=Nesterenkonia natronophila TaxID=2174932 RepID=A0A3A4FYS9_9MICC|nr:hypothetical protein [Nesterenkonia natronophila]RJN31189.1 hypothetical protein D3250_10060 [Nesterenkonia natronophila]